MTLEPSTEGRIFIDGLQFKNINEVFQRLFNINDRYGEQLSKEDWNLILEHTKCASLLIPPMEVERDTIDQKAWLKSLGESYYVVEINNRYYVNEIVVMADNELYEHSIRTTDSLLECKRFDSYASAKEISDKYNCTVRKVVVRVEE